MNQPIGGQASTEPDVRFLVVGEDPSGRAAAVEILRRRYQRAEFLQVGEPQELPAAPGRIDLTVADFHPGSSGGMGLLALVRKRLPQAPLIIYTDHNDAEAAMALVRFGASDYVLRDHPERLELAVQRCLPGPGPGQGGVEAEMRRRTDEAGPAEKSGQRDTEQIVGRQAWNRGAEERYGWSREEALGQRAHLLLRTEFMEPVEQVYATLLREGHWAGELVHTRRDGTRLVVESRWALERDSDGQPVTILEINTDITERKRAERALRESEQRYRQMFEKNRAIKMLIDPETGDIVQANWAASDFYGYSPDQLAQMKIGMINVLPEREVLDILLQAIRDEPTSLVFRHRLASGQIRDVDVSASRLDMQGRELIYTIIHDITERKQAERALWHHTKRLQILHDIDQAILALKSPGEIAQTALRHVRQVVPTRHASVMLFDFDNREVEVLAVDTPASEWLQSSQRFPLDAAWVPDSLWQNNVHLIEDLAASPESSPALDPLRAEGVRSYLSVPLVARGQLIGQLNLGSGRTDTFELKHVDIARQVADSLAVAIQNARSYEGEQRARQTAETLRAANMALTQSLDLDSVFATLLEYMHRLVPYDSASVLLVTEDEHVVMRGLQGYEQWADPAQIEALETTPFDLNELPSMAEVLQEHQSKIIADTQSFEGWQPRAGSGHVRSWLGVPLIARGSCIGLVSIDKAEPGFFKEGHMRLAEALAAQAAVAILNARLFEQVREGRQQLQTLSRRLVDVQERERRHVARELHDEAGQALTSLMVNLGLLEREANCTDSIVSQLEGLKRTVDGVLEDLHSLAVNLRPVTLDYLGLEPALRQYVESVQRQHGLNVQFETLGLGTERMDSDTETSLYRIVQEALSNVVQHARATQAGVLLERRGERMVAIIEDNGVGFDPDQAMRRGRLGLVSMRERAEMLGGRLSVESAPGQGTSVFVEIPYLPGLTAGANGQ